MAKVIDIMSRTFRSILPVGEMSALRRRFSAGTRFWSPYKLDSSRVNYELARRLYRNTDDRYKLGAWAARPVVDVLAGFVGQPHFKHEADELQQALDDTLEAWGGTFLRINRNVFRDGDVFARIYYQPGRLSGQDEWSLRLIPPEWVTPVPDPVNGGWMEVVIQYPVKRVEANRSTETDYTIVERITKGQITYEFQGDVPSSVREALQDRVNSWGFIPLVHFRNEAEETEMFGASELEPIEPFMKAYHDLMLAALEGGRLIARPKTKLKLSSVETFLRNNFPGVLERIQRGEEVKLDFASRDMYLMGGQDDIEFITADTGLQGISTLLKFIFRCIVDVSGIPEFVFGTAIASSKASASEQMIPFIRRVARKRGILGESYQELAQMWLAMQAKVGGVAVEDWNVGIEWDEVSPRDDLQVAQTIEAVVRAMVEGVEAMLISQDAAAEFLREFIPSMLTWRDVDAADDEFRRVARTMAIMARLRDGDGLELTGTEDE